MKTLLITGMTSDVARSVINTFASMGYNIVGLYHQNDKIAKEIRDIVTNKYKVKVDILKCDLSKEEDIEGVYHYLIKNKYKIDILINNAATYCDSTIDEKSKQEFMRVLEVNLVGPFLVVKYMSKLINKEGIIINMASTDGINTNNEYNYDYAASKAGLINLTKSLALILKEVKVYCLSPNWIDTKSTREMSNDYLKKELDNWNQSRLITTNEIAKVIKNIISTNKKTGTNFIINIKDNNLVVEESI